LIFLHDYNKRNYLIIVACLLSFIVTAAKRNVRNEYHLTVLKPTEYGFSGRLDLVIDGHIYEPGITPLQLDIFFETNNRLHFKIYDPFNRRWEVPWVRQTPVGGRKAPNPNYSVSFTQRPFGISVTRRTNNQTIFNSTSSGLFNDLVFEDHYLEISTEIGDGVNPPNIYGLGEREYKIRLDVGKVYVIWTRDQPTGVIPFVNLYGAHPFHLEMRHNLSHGIFLLNSNAMSVEVENRYLTYRVVGGILDFYIFMGPTPEEVTQQYHEVIGYPFMPPYFALGYSQSCLGWYHTLNETWAVVNNFDKYQIPLEMIWNDIDQTDANKDFTWDPVRFPAAQVQQFVSWLHSRGQKYALMCDPAIAIQKGYASYEELIASGLYIRTANGSAALVGKLFPGAVIFPDFTDNRTTNYWLRQFTRFHKDYAPFDVMMLDMNEISNFCNGTCSSSEKANNDKRTKTSRSSLSNKFDPDYPPYCPTEVPLNTGTVTLSALLKMGLNYNIHSIYNYAESVATALAMKTIRGTRPLVITRATFAGVGKYAGHWLGDNQSTFQSMYYSLPGMLTMNIFGIPMVGADICGFHGNATKELCTRWTELGALTYSFAWNHNYAPQRRQEPYSFGPELIKIAREVLLLRNSLLPYWYTLFHHVHIRGGTVLRPLFFEFPSDANTYEIDKQVMLGPAFLISPVVDESKVSLDVYFPQTRWYDYFTRVAIENVGWMTLDTPLDKINLHVRGGYIIPMQQGGMTTTASRLNPFRLLVALDHNGNAQGSLFWDDGETVDTWEKGDYLYINYVHAQNILKAEIVHNGYKEDMNVLQNVTVLGLPTRPHRVLINGQPTKSWHYNSEDYWIDIFFVNLKMKSPWTIQFIGHNE